jgi:hypothetical protein
MIKHIVQAKKVIWNVAVVEVDDSIPANPLAQMLQGVSVVGDIFSFPYGLTRPIVYSGIPISNAE